MIFYQSRRMKLSVLFKSRTRYLERTRLRIACASISLFAFSLTACPKKGGGLPYRFGTLLTFGTGGNGDAYEAEGWSTPEVGHTWSDHPQANLSFQIQPSNQPLQLRMKLTGLVKAPTLPFQPVEVLANDTKIAEWNVGPEGTDYATIIPGDLVRGGRTLKIALKIPKATSPKLLGIGDDNRLVGVAISELQIKKTN
jgi:hypothetical protein